MTSFGARRAARETQLDLHGRSRAATATTAPGPPNATRPRLSLTTLRWITIGAPIAALLVFFHLTAFVLSDAFRSPVGYALAVGAAALAVIVFSHLVFVAIERLERRITDQNARLAAAAAVAVALNGSSDWELTLQQALEGVCRPLGVDAGALRVVDPTSGSSSTALYGLSADPFASPETDRVDRELASVLSQPVAAHGATEGTVMIASRQPGYLGPQDRDLLENIGSQIAVAVQRARLLAEVVDRNEELQLINGYATALSTARDVPEVVDVVLGTLVTASDARSGEFWSEVDGRFELVDRIEVGASGRAATGFGGTDAADSVAQRARAVSTGDPSFEVRGGSMQGCLPLRAGGHIIAIAVLLMADGHAPAAGRRRLLTAIADQGAVALSDARNRLRVREVAVLEERGRLAREMHDGFAQVLGYLNTKTFAIRRTLTDGDVVEAEAMLADLEGAARDASVDVREGVLALRTADPGSGGLVASLGSYVEKFERMSGIPVRWRPPRNGAAIQLTEMAQIQLLRLVQEALSNVRKHARATQATVSLEADRDALEVRIDDDGQGFDTSIGDRSEGEHFGLQTMRERAEAVGAQFSVASGIGSGTHVKVTLPLATRIGRVA